MFRTLIDRIPLFMNLNQEVIEEFLVITRTVSFSPGEVIIAEGEKLAKFFILLDGNAESETRLIENDDLYLSMKGPGDIVGEIKLLIPGEVYYLNVLATTAVQALEVSYRDFLELFFRKPGTGYSILKAMYFQARESDLDIIKKLQSEVKRLEELKVEFTRAQNEILPAEDFERELQVARRIQKGILPRKLPHFPGFDFGVRMAQARAVGGDFFDFIPLSRDTIGIAIGDVSGKGVPASIFMAVTRSLLRAEAHNGILPRHVLQRVNYHMMDMNEYGLFVTVLYGVLNRIDHTFKYARAGHEIPLIFDDDCSSDCIERGNGQALGIFVNPQFDENEITLGSNSLLLLHTDGVTDAIDKNEAAFGLARLKEVILKSKDDSAQVICDNVVDAITSFIGSTAQFDDLTLVGIKSA